MIFNLWPLTLCSNVKIEEKYDNVLLNNLEMS